MMRKLLKRQGFVPTSIVTGRHGADDAALRDLGLSRVHIRGKPLNNRGEYSRVPIR
jgi:transposase-like protein